MTTEALNTFMDSINRGVLFGFAMFVYGYVIISVLKWMFGVIKRVLHFLFPKVRWFQSKEDLIENETE